MSHMMMYCYSLDPRFRLEIPKLYTAPCNGIFSNGAQIGDNRIHTDNTRANQCKKKTKTKQNCAHDFCAHSLACRAAFHMCLSSHSEQRGCRWHKHLRNPVILTVEKPKYPQLDPHDGRKMALIPESRVSICSLNLSGWISSQNYLSICFEISPNPLLNSACPVCP